ncbi:XTP/dITP diphosphatase [Clostridium paraputrificum]|uniref:XTP/dITP diphosphatase n=1 Tax=Clostridium TaxID=1485 RepID=UPI003D356AD4
MKKIILASNNAHKIEEFKEILKELPIEVKSLKDENIDIEVEEDGKTFEENAKKKASEIASYLKDRGDNNYIVIADDSGLEVDYLNGAPGIYSARYAGEHGDDSKNNIKLLANLKGVPTEKRGGNFVCQLALIDSNNNYMAIRGDVRGIILDELSCEGGFGYDPLFFYEPLGKSFGELAGEEKNKISHRAVALKKLKERIGEFI